MSLRIFIHALRMVFADLGASLKVTGVLYLFAYVLIAAPFVIFLGTADIVSVMSDPNGPPNVEGGFLLSVLVGVVGYITLSTWLAICWHRYVLLGEIALSFPTGKVGPYFWRGFGYAIAAFLPVVIVGGIIVTAAGQGAAVVVDILVTVVGLFLLFRISMGLPGLCVDQHIDLQESWKRTAPFSGMILGTTLILAVVSTVFSLLVAGLLSGAGGASIVVVMALNLIIGWMQLMVGLSLLTTFYGVSI
ncbi:MAG: hypothetical protein AAF386_14450, partial [Pseudomonadota bacterium]